MCFRKKGSRVLIQGFDSFLSRDVYNPRRARGSQSGRENRQDESFQIREKELLGTDSHRTISKNSGGFRLLIGQKKCVVLLCPIGEQFLLSSFREFIHDGYFLVKQAYRRQKPRSACGEWKLQVLCHYTTGICNCKFTPKGG